MTTPAGSPAPPRLSPTLLTRFAACRHAARLQLNQALGRSTPEMGRDPDADMLAELGSRHEAAYLDHLRAQGLRVEVVGTAQPGGTERVLELMHEGVDVIAQAPMAVGPWSGIADVLRKVEGASRLGDYHYEVEDTKLSRTTRAATVLQLMTYAAWLDAIQGTPGEYAHVVAPGDDHEPFAIDRLRVDDYAAVVRRATRMFERFVQDVVAGTATTRPEPVEHCAVCPWWRACGGQWREEDHLSLVANLGTSHQVELKRHGVTTRRALAAQHGGLSFRPEFGRPDAYLAAAHQADVQVRSEARNEVLVEALPAEEGQGLSRLPETNEHDLYLDLEGTPFYGSGGIEYLWGWSGRDGKVTHVWSEDPKGEKQAFERFIDTVTAHRLQHPAAHVYHFGGYEPGALKRLMSRHATREEELDALLRAEVFVDLMPVTRQAFRIGVASYGLKDLERVHGYLREEDLRGVGPHKRLVEHGLILGMAGEMEPASREVVATYNADDVRSTIALHDWLEAQRVAQGVTAKPNQEDGDPSENLAEQRTAATEMIEALQAKLPEDEDDWNDEQRALALLANLIDFERRESKVAYWEKFAHQAMTDEELEASPKGIAGLRHLGHVGGTARVPIHRYTYPSQDLDVRSRDDLYVSVIKDGQPAFERLGIAAHDIEQRWLDVKQGKGLGDYRLAKGFFWNKVPDGIVTNARMAFAADVVDRGLSADGQYRAARDLLLGLVGRSAAGVKPVGRLNSEASLEASKRIARSLQGGILPIQGPPGAGKTFTAARMILALVDAERTVGVTAVSNKVVSNLLKEVVVAAREAGSGIVVAQKVGDGGAVPDGVQDVDYPEAAAGLRAGAIHVMGGTAWTWTRPEFHESIDTLVIDEAGQFSLASALSVATAARNVVLLGDPRQLAQPIQAAHPDGADVAALDHLLAGHATLPEGRGLFLDRTYRMAPSVTAFISEQFYEGRLEAIPKNAQIRLSGTDGLDGTGITHVPVPHEGRDGVAPEEVHAVLQVMRRLLARPGTYHDNEGKSRKLYAKDVLVVAPFNRQVNALHAALEAEFGEDVRVGTVDRFQGQEAPVVIYSMAVSSQDLAPRGLEFLFSPNRFNVAISRAQARAVLVACPTLFDELPGTKRGLELLNSHVRVLEVPG